MPRRPFRFGVQASGAADRRGWAELARRVEDLGYSVLTMADHLDDQLAPVPALMAAADATTDLRIGPMVLANDYRHPVVLAKEATTIDLLSGGRLELGLGAGWMQADYDQAGITLDRPGVRIDRLAEAIAVMKGLLAGGPFTFAGEHYRVNDLAGRPRPAQRPHPPIVIGGGGRRVLALAARQADIVGVNVDLRAGVIDATTGPTGTADATAEKIGWIRQAAGARFDDLELQVRVHVAAITDDKYAMADAMAPALGVTPAEALASPHAVVGSAAEVIDILVERRERWGISYLGLSADALEAFAPVVAALAGT
ncbi:LLM class F420-dependent oxidoreductase [soil metagenome]